jgi:hypothetical protein
MQPTTVFRKRGVALSLIALLMTTPILDACKTASPSASAALPGNSSTKIFDELADTALLAMKKRAEELKITGVAVVAYAEGDKVKSWSSKMLVVGNMILPGSGNNAGDNRLGIAYTKASEMADTLKDSGSKVRRPYHGEYGWQGGVTAKGKSGILIVAFSGGASEQDVQVSHAGLEVLAAKL